jgi:putative ABC transport system permease protein
LVSGVSALNRKLGRDLWRLRGQVFAVALVIASGVAVLVMSLSALTSLRATTDAYYERHRFAEVFATVKRAPDSMMARIAAIPGVQTAESRISHLATLDVPGMDEPVVGRLVSLPDLGAPLLNRPALRAGRFPRPGRDDEAVLHEPFAEAHGLRIGDGLRIILNGTKREVRVVGTALSPEFVYALGPGMMMPDDLRYAVVWMGRKALAAAYDLDGAFNDVTLDLARGVDPRGVIERLDLLLADHGGTGAIDRADQLSNWFLMNEFQQLKTQATVLPAIFLIAAAFLTNTIVARLIATERREISLMKAFGYSNLRIVGQYAGLAVAIAALGVALGAVVGSGLGRYMTELFSIQYRFPFLYYRPSGIEFVLAGAVSLLVTVTGAVWAVRRVVALAPAEAMRPPTPESFRDADLFAGATRRLDSATRIILRQIGRAPIRSGTTVVGTALALAVMMLALQWPAAIDRLARAHFSDTQHQNVTIGFAEVRPARGRFDLARLPGVLSVQPVRLVSADIRAGLSLHRGSVTGLTQDAALETIYDTRGYVLPVPRGGVVLGTKLAEKLDVGVGDRVRIEVQEGARPVLDAPVVGLTETYLGVPVFMDFDVLNRAMGDPPVFNQAHLLIDDHAATDLYAALKDTPAVSSITVKEAAERKFHETLGETILIFVGFFVMFAGALAIGVLYNAIRIALSERERELATLRVLGFTRREISYVLLGEAALLTLLALPLGYGIGVGLIRVMNKAFETELFRVPEVLSLSIYGEAVLIVLAAGVVCGWLVRRRLRTLDLIAVLKTRE